MSRHVLIGVAIVTFALAPVQGDRAMFVPDWTFKGNTLTGWRVLGEASFRLTGIYGTRQLGGEDHGWVANFVIRNRLGWPVTLFGTGKQVRDIVYATDVAEAFLAFHARGEAGVYNVGGGPATAISLLECIALIDEQSGRRTEVQMQDARFGDLQYFVCDIERARQKLGWRPTILPREGVSRLIAWVEANADLFVAPGTRSSA